MNVSVIIPAYNAESYLSCAMDSVLSQTIDGIEIIIIDDGSSDGTKKIISQYRERYPKQIRDFYQENAGAASARNKGFEEAKGRYIAFLDADDVWLPKKLEKQIALLDKKPGAGFVYCDNDFVDSMGNVLTNYIRKIKLIRGDILPDLFLDFFLITSGVVMRKECAESIENFNENLKVSEDYEYFLRLAEKFECDVLEEKLFKRTVRADSLSRQNPTLDATMDARILSNFVQKRPRFYRLNKSRVETRLADAYFTIAYHFLENGKNRLALTNFIASLRYKISRRTLRNIALCILPFRLRKLFKGYYALSQS